MSKSYSFLLLLAIVVFMGACKTKKNLSSTKPEPKGTAVEELSRQKLVENILQQKNSSEWLYAKAEVNYKDDKQDLSFDMEIQAHQDDYIWLNARAMGLLNVARILIKPDSIRIIDLMNKVYISASYDYLKKFSPSPIGFKQLQNIVWGNAPFDPTATSKIDTTTQKLLITLLVGNGQQESGYLSNLKTQKTTLLDLQTRRSMSIDHEHFMDFGQNSIPSTRIFNIQSEKKVECRFQLNNIALSFKREPSFVIPKTYKVLVY